MGLLVNSFYAGSFLHADDIRILASNVSSMEEQVAMVATGFCKAEPLEAECTEM